MSKPVSAVVAAIRAWRGRPGVRIFGLGNAGIVVQCESTALIVDPWLSDWLERRDPRNPDPIVRAHPSRVAPEQIGELGDAIAVTHEHPDHLDPGLAGPVTAAGMPLLLPRGCVSAARELGFGDGVLHPIDANGRTSLGPFTIEAVPVWHAMEPGGTGRYGPWLDGDGATRAVGYAISVGGVVLFHGGDLVYSPGLDERLASLDIDVALLPINGRDWRRERSAGLVGNLTGVEAVELAASIGAAVLIPIHFDGVVGNTATPSHACGHASERYPHLTFHVLGEAVPFVVPT